jgi:hypothetical protein
MTTATASVPATINQIVDAAMKTRKGVNVNLSWQRPCKTRKTCQDRIEKRTETVGRVGIDYSNRAIVQEMREAGELPEKEQPIWRGKGEWLLFPYIIRHTGTNQLYLRLYQGSSPNYKPSVQYFRNGVEVSKESVESELLASEKRSDTRLCFVVRLEDVLSIGKVEEPAEVEQEAVAA